MAHSSSLQEASFVTPLSETVHQGSSSALLELGSSAEVSEKSVRAYPARTWASPADPAATDGGAGLSEASSLRYHRPRQGRREASRGGRTERRGA